MLVKQSIVESWYEKSSWVFKNFSYLFQNPLWNKSVPKGFSVCPYFWLSIFSLFIFRPFFVAPLQYLAKPLLKLTGKAGERVDEFLYNQWAKTKLVDKNYHLKGLGALVTAVAIMLTAVAVLFGCFLYSSIGALHGYLSPIPLGNYAFWSIASLAILAIIISIHKKVSKTNCQTQYYLYLWFALFMVGAFVFLPSEMWAGIVSIGKGFVFAGVAIWEFLCWAISGIGTGLWWAGWGILWFIKFLAVVIFSALIWCPISALPVPWWGYIIGATAASYFGGKWLLKLGDMIPEPKLSTKEIHANNRAQWAVDIRRALVGGKYWDDEHAAECIYDNISNKSKFGSEKHTRRALQYSTHRIYTAAVDRWFSNQLDILEKYKPLNLSRVEWTTILTDGRMSDRSAMLQAILTGHPELKDAVVDLRINSDNFFEAMSEVLVSDKDINRYVMDLIREFERAEDARKNSKLNKLCLIVTTKIGQGVDVFFEAGLALGKLIGRAFCAVGRGIAWVAVQFATLVAYLWMFAKAKKKGACPYFMFKDTPTAPTQKSA